MSLLPFPRRRAPVRRPRLIPCGPPCGGPCGCCCCCSGGGQLSRGLPRGGRMGRRRRRPALRADCPAAAVRQRRRRPALERTAPRRALRRPAAAARRRARLWSGLPRGAGPATGGGARLWSGAAAVLDWGVEASTRRLPLGCSSATAGAVRQDALEAGIAAVRVRRGAGLARILSRAARGTPARRASSGGCCRDCRDRALEGCLSEARSGVPISRGAEGEFPRAQWDGVVVR